MNLEEKTLYSERIFDGKVLNLRVDTVLLPDGREAKREIVEHKGAVAIVPILEGSKIVMVRQFRQATGEILVEIPAGTMDRTESAEECAKRELIEEIGYSTGKLTKLFSTYLSPGYSNEMLHTYIAEDLTKVEAQPEQDEFLQIIIVDVEEALDMIRTGEIKDAKTVCGVLMAQQIVGCE